MKPKHVVLDHSVSADSTNLRKDREWAGCRLCGAVFQAALAVNAPDHAYTDSIAYEVKIETEAWRVKHNKTHNPREHIRFRETGLTFTPAAAKAFASYGLVSIVDAQNAEIAQALLEASRLPYNDLESTLKGVY